MRISRRTRELAAQLCSMAACNEMMVVDAINAAAIDPGDDAAWLAHRALERCLRIRDTRRWYAEAEALLRTGWEP